VDVAFTSVAGHIKGLDFIERFKGWGSCDPVALFEAPIEKFVPEVCFQNSFTERK
jgi:DNA topoisomerase-3